MLPDPDRRRRRYPRLAAGAGAVLIAALAALLIPLAASAQEPRVMAFEQPASGTITLQPGVNEVGWLAESADPQALFDEIPQLETIWTWHTLDQRWQAAARDVPSNLWTLYRLVPGMGLRLQITGDSPVQWQRSLVPASGKVELQPGNNFVAWAGRDGWDVNRLAKGIGRQLQEIYSHNPDTGEHDAIWPVAEGAEPATVARGAALWIKMPRTIVWLQPTDILPRLVFPGGAPENVQAAATRDLRNTLDYFATEYGIQADTAGLEIWMPLDLDALKQQLRDEDEEFDDISLDDLWSRTAGWAGSRLVVIALDDDNPATPVDDISYQRAMTHEYFHQIQGDLSYGGDYAPLWIVEGTASYAESDQQVASDDRTWKEIESDLHGWIYDVAPRLISVEEQNSTWQYVLGEIALRRLVEESHPRSWVDFYRELAPTATSPSNRWQSARPWRDVFKSTFEIGINEFYAEFDVWLADPATRNGNRPADEAFDELPRAEGRVLRADGTPVAGRYVSLNGVQLDANGDRHIVGWQQRAETDADGNFSVIAPINGQHVLDVDLGAEQNCIIYYSDARGTINWDDARLLTIAGQTLRNIRFTLATDACTHQLRGTVRGPDGTPLPGVELIARYDNVYQHVRTGQDGAFTVILPVSADDLYLRLNLSNLPSSYGCDVYVANSSVTTAYRHRTLMSVRGVSAPVDIQVPAGTCERVLTGTIVNDDGRPRSKVNLWLWGPGGSKYFRTDTHGTFRIIVPTFGSYKLVAGLAEGCDVSLGASGRVIAFAFGSGSDAELFDLSAADAYRNFRISNRWCQHTISGRLLDSDGQPLAGVYISARGDDGEAYKSDPIDEDGAFTLTVPQDGRYRLRIQLAESCAVYFVRDGIVTLDRDAATMVRVASKDVRVDIRVPTNPANACGNSISGRLLDSSGEPIMRVSMNMDGPEWFSGTTDSSGGFSVPVSQDGSYVIRIHLVRTEYSYSCPVYFAGNGGVTADRYLATEVRVAGAGVRIGDIRVPTGICSNTISGRLLDSSGEPIVKALYARSADHSGIQSSTQSDHTGAFSVTVPQNGNYYFTTYSSPGYCPVYFAGNGGVTADHYLATEVRVADGDVHIGDIRVPDDICSNQ